MTEIGAHYILPQIASVHVTFAGRFLASPLEPHTAHFAYHELELCSGDVAALRCSSCAVSALAPVSRDSKALGVTLVSILCSADAIAIVVASRSVVGS